MTALRRHALAWLSQPPRAEADADAALVAAWHDAGRPFVVCRQRAAGELSPGLCAIAAGTPRPRRIAAHAAPAALRDVGCPPALAELARCPAAAERADLFEALAVDAAAAGLEPRVYGSWMWQALTGDTHVRGASDLDVLIDVATPAAADAAAAWPDDAAGRLPFALDGELSIADRGEVHWREYRSDAAELMVKSVTAVRLLRREELWT